MTVRNSGKRSVIPRFLWTISCLHPIEHDIEDERESVDEFSRSDSTILVKSPTNSDMITSLKLLLFADNNLLSTNNLADSVFPQISGDFLKLSASNLREKYHNDGGVPGGVI